MKKIISTAILVAVITSCSHNIKKYDCGSDKCVVGRFVESVSMFDNVNHTVKEDFPELFNDPIELDAESLRCIDSLNTDYHIAMGIKQTCEMMKAYVHQKGLALRATAPAETVDALEHFEASFDTLFHRCVSQEYYLRLFHDCFNETIPEALDSLVAACRKFAVKELDSQDIY